MKGAVHSGGTWYYGVSGKDIELNMKPEYSLRINNLPTGTTYTITEGELPPAFNFDNAALSIEDGTGQDQSFKGGQTTTGTIENTNTLYKVTFTNTYELVDVSVDKIWDDHSDALEKRPETLELTLSGAPEGFEVPEPEVVKNGDTWTYTWSGLPRYDSNKTEITYTVTENKIPDGYISEEDQADGSITNILPLGSLEIIKKIGGLPNGEAPGELTFTVKGPNGYSMEIKYSQFKNGSYTIEDLPVGEYTVTESKTDYTGYTLEESTVMTLTDEVKKDETTPFNFTNNYSQDLGSLTITKTITGLPDGAAPEKLSFRIKGPNGYSEEIDYSDFTDGSFTIKDLPVGEYTVEEIGADYVGYTLKSTVEPESAAVEKGKTATIEIVNEYELIVTDITVVKTWDDAKDQDGKRSTVAASVQLYKTVGEEKTAVGEPVKVGTEDDWTYTWTDQPVYENGAQISYSVEETLSESSGYKKSGDAELNKAEEGKEISISIKNSYVPETVEISGKKTWADADDQDGKRPESITINLLANGTKVDSKTVTEADEWEWSFTGKPKYEAGKEITYSITEEDVDGYEIEVKDFNVTNTHTPETTEVSGSKTWDDADNQDGKRPESITISLLANGTKIESKTVTEADGWKWTFTGLPKFEAGKEITYTITEDAVEGYEAKVEGFNVTNTHEPETVEISGSKTWDDADNQDGVRPETITVKLLADGKVVASQLVSAETGWKWTFTKMAKYAEGKEIVYTVTESSVPGYTATVTGFDIKNTHVPGTVSVEGKKTWDDGDDQDGIRPESITVNLFADGTKVDTRTVTEADEWKWVFANLPQKKAGKDIVYTITEDPIEGYETKIEGYNITNIHTPTPTEPPTDPPTEPSTEPATEPPTEPSTEPATEPPTEPATEPATEPSTEPPKPPVPDTGDHFSMWLWIGIFGLAACGAGGLLIASRRRKDS